MKAASPQQTRPGEDVKGDSHVLAVTRERRTEPVTIEATPRPPNREAGGILSLRIAESNDSRSSHRQSLEMQYGVGQGASWKKQWVVSSPRHDKEAATQQSGDETSLQSRSAGGRAGETRQDADAMLLKRNALRNISKSTKPRKRRVRYRGCS